MRSSAAIMSTLQEPLELLEAGGEASAAELAHSPSRHWRRQPKIQGNGGGPNLVSPGPSESRDLSAAPGSINEKRA